jgi:hypothetical protein
MLVIKACTTSMREITFLVVNCAGNDIWKEKQPLLFYHEHSL